MKYDLIRDEVIMLVDLLDSHEGIMDSVSNSLADPYKLREKLSNGAGGIERRPPRQPPQSNPMPDPTQVPEKLWIAMTARIPGKVTNKKRKG